MFSFKSIIFECFSRSRNYSVKTFKCCLDLQRISAQLKSAEMHAGQADADEAVAALDQALNIAASIHTGRNEALENATQTWYESWFPRVSEANGRRFLDKVDDVKDHLPVRTVDMSYLIYRELLYPLGRLGQPNRRGPKRICCGASSAGQDLLARLEEHCE